MPAPDFTRVTGRLYAMPDWPAAYFAGADAVLGDTATLSGVWADRNGVFLFLGEVPSDPSAFADAFAQWIARAPLPRIAWLADPNEPSDRWAPRTLRATRSEDGAWTVSRQALFDAGRYAVMLDTGAPLELRNDGIEVARSFVRFAAPGVTLTPDANAFLPLSGADTGSWTMPLTLPQGADGLAQLDAGLRYTVPSSDPEEVLTIGMPVVRQELSTPIALALAFDPLRVYMPDRSRLDFAAGSPPLRSTFITTFGYRTTLTPLAAAPPLRAGRLAFCRTPLGRHPDAAFFDPYLAPDGAFAVTIVPPANGAGTALPNRLVLGQSGVEYVDLRGEEGAIAFFEAGRPAFAPNALPVSGTKTGPLLTPLATTSYVTFLPPSGETGGFTYYAQPPQAPFFEGSVDLGAGFLEYLELPSATLPPRSESVPPTLPVGVYRGIEPELAPAARLLESAGLAPARRAALELPDMSMLLEAMLRLAVTPQGLVATVAADGSRLDGIVLGNMTNPPDVLRLTRVEEPLQRAIQSTELFFVVSSADTFLRESSVEYQIIEANLALMPVALADSLRAIVAPLGYPVYETEEAFVAAIGATAGAGLPLVLSLTGRLKPNLSGWNFQLSPRSWRTAEDTPTFLIFKFCKRSLEEMIADTSTWGWQEAARDAEGSVVPAQKKIQALFEAARNADPGTPYRDFYDEIVANEAWNGMLFLNAPIAISELPPELQFLIAGINLDEFYAHHVGFSVTPFEGNEEGGITLKQTAVFGLIDYNDPEDLRLETNVELAFKTLALRAVFKNAALRDFSAEVELMVNRLFFAPVTKRASTRGNNLILLGSYQKQNGRPSYSFTLQGLNLYDVDGSALDEIEVLNVQLQTRTGSSTAGEVAVDFILAGNLGFTELDDFDLFSYGTQRITPVNLEPVEGYLRYGNLVVSMAFFLRSPGEQTFDAQEGSRMSFDLTASVPRPRSLAANFPVRVTSLLAVESGQRPEEMGYISIAAPLEQTPLAPPWYGLVHTIDLGSLGALTGSTAVSIEILAAWAPGNEAIYLGLRIPGTNPLTASLPIQGVVRLGFRSFEFTASEADDPALTRTYMLRLRRYSLSILGWSFPPGNADVFLFGDPDNGAKSLGWYGSYVPDVDITTTNRSAPAPRALARLSDDAAAAPPRHLRAGRRSFKNERGSS
jgi:hypothetical protein